MKLFYMLSQISQILNECNTFMISYLSFSLYAYCSGFRKYNCLLCFMIYIRFITQACKMGGSGRLGQKSD